MNDKKGTKTSFFSTIFADFLNQDNIQFEPEFKIKNSTIKNLLKNELENQKYSKLDLNVNRFMDFYIPKYNLFIELNTLFTHCTEKHEKIHELKRDLAKKLNKDILFIWDSHFKEHEFKDDEICLYARYGSKKLFSNLKLLTQSFDNLDNAKSQFKKKPYFYSGTIEDVRKRHNKVFTSLTLEEMKEKWPEWFQDRIIDKKPRKYIKFNPALYNWWLKICKGEDENKQVKVGHRYYCALALVSFATKCEISKDKLIEDLHSLISIFNSLIGSENNPFLESDIEEALKIYGTDKAYKFKRDYIALQCGIEIPKTKRNGRTRQEHLKRLHTINRMKKAMGIPVIRKTPKRKAPVRDKIREYLKNNPQKKPLKDIAEELNISLRTLRNNYSKIKNEIESEKISNSNSSILNNTEKILYNILFQNPEMNKTELSKSSGIGYKTTLRYYDKIKLLIDEEKKK